jgi:quinol monooxygenase YgiN
MYGLIVKMGAVPGQRDALIAILAVNSAALPGCLSYVVAKDLLDENEIWITEIWDSKESHDESLSHPAVTSAIAAGRPLIAGIGLTVLTEPIGEHGLRR